MGETPLPQRDHHRELLAWDWFAVLIGDLTKLGELGGVDLPNLVPTPSDDRLRRLVVVDEVSLDINDPDGDRLCNWPIDGGESSRSAAAPRCSFLADPHHPTDQTESMYRRLEFGCELRSDAPKEGSDRKSVV